MIRIHFDGPQTCTICGHTSPNSSALKTHARKHQPDFKSRWKCTDCGRGFPSKMNLVVSVNLTFHPHFIQANYSQFFAMTSRNILTSTPVSPADTIANIAAKYFGSAHRLAYTRRKCIQNKCGRSRRNAAFSIQFLAKATQWRFFLVHSLFTMSRMAEPTSDCVVNVKIKLNFEINFTYMWSFLVNECRKSHILNNKSHYLLFFI